MGKVRLDGETLWCTTVLVGVAFLVLYPILLIVLNSFQVARPGTAPVYGLQGWRTALSDPGMRQAVYNTFSLILTRQLISFPVAILLAWLLARTDLPARSALGLDLGIGPGVWFEAQAMLVWTTLP